MLEERKRLIDDFTTAYKASIYIRANLLVLLDLQVFSNIN